MPLKLSMLRPDPALRPFSSSRLFLSASLFRWISARLWSSASFFPSCSAFTILPRSFSILLEILLRLLTLPHDFLCGRSALPFLTIPLHHLPRPPQLLLLPDLILLILPSCILHVVRQHGLVFRFL